MEEDQELDAFINQDPQLNQTQESQMLPLKEELQKEIQQPEQINLTLIDKQKKPENAESVLEFLLLTLSQALDIEIEQAAGMFTNNNKFLSFAVIKGMKGDFQPIEDWLKNIYDLCPHLVTLVEDEQSSDLSKSTLTQILNALKSGFLSLNINVVHWTAKVFQRVAYEFANQGELMGQAWDWFVDEANGCLEILLKAIENNQTIIHSLVPVLIQFGRYNFGELFTHQMRKYIPNVANFFSLVHDFLGPINAVQFAREEFQESGIAQYLIDQCIKKSDTTNGEVDTNKFDRQGAFCKIIQLLGLLCSLWSMYPENFEQIVTPEHSTRIYAFNAASQINMPEQTLSQVALNVLKRNCRDRSFAIRMTAICQMFRILDQFSTERNKIAPTIYKTLIFSLVENHQDFKTRELFVQNFSFLFERVVTIPVGLLIEPYVKLIHFAEGSTFKYQLFDFEFFLNLARHPRLNLKTGIQLVDLMAKVFLNPKDFDYQQAAAVPMQAILMRFLDHAATQQFLKRFLTLCAFNLVSLENETREAFAARKREDPQLYAEHETLNVPQRTVFNAKAEENKEEGQPLDNFVDKRKPIELLQNEEREKEYERKIRKHRLVEMIKTVVGFRNTDVNQDVKTAILKLLVKQEKEGEEKSKILLHLLNWWWGPPLKLLEGFKEGGAESVKSSSFYVESGRDQQQSETTSRILSRASSQRSILQQIQQTQRQQKPPLGQYNTAKQDQKLPKIRRESKLRQPTQIDEPKKGMTRNQSLPDLGLQKESMQNQAKKQQIEELKRQMKEQKKQLEKEKKGSQRKQEHEVSQERRETQRKGQSKRKQSVESSYERKYEMEKKDLEDQMRKMMMDTENKKKAQAQEKELKELQRKEKQSKPYQDFLAQKRGNEKLYNEKLPQNKRVMENLRKIQDKRKEEEMRKKLEEEIKEMKEKQTRRTLRKEIKKRKEELGVQDKIRSQTRGSKSRSRGRFSDSESSEDENKTLKEVLIVDPDETVEHERKMLKLERKKKQGMQLLNLAFDEEQRDVQAVSMFLQKYKLLFKQIYNKYANTVGRSNIKQNFERISHEDHLVSIAELRKFAQDHGITPDLMTVKELEKMIKKMNMLAERTQELKYLDFSQFQNFFIQIAHYVFRTKNVRAKSDQTITEILEDLLNHMRKSQMYAGKETRFYDDPDFVAGTDRKLVYQMNQKLKKDPNFEPPEGFYKVYEKDLTFSHTLPKNPAIKESRKIAIEYLDDFLNKLFGFHFIEPRAIIGQVPKIKQHPKVYNPTTGVAQHKSAAKEYFTQASVSQAAAPPLIVLSKTVKETMQDKNISLDVAEVTQYLVNETVRRDEIMRPQIIPEQPVRETVPTLPPLSRQGSQTYLMPDQPQRRGWGQQSALGKSRSTSVLPQLQMNQLTQGQGVLNSIQTQQLQQRLIQEHQQREREIKRKRHEKELKQRMAFLQEQKVKTEEENEQMKKKRELTEQEKARKAEERRQEEFRLKKQALAEKKQRDLDHKRELQEIKAKQFQKEAVLKAEQKKQFLKEQKKKLKENFNEKIKDRKDLEKTEKEVELKTKKKEEKIKNNMIKYLEETKPQFKEREIRQRQQMEHLYQDHDTKVVFKNYEKALKQLFKYYSTQDGIKLDQQLDNKVKTISLNEFMKFGMQHNVYPTLVSLEDSKYVFRQTINDMLLSAQSKNDKIQIESNQAVDYENFKKSLIRIAAIANEKFRGDIIAEETVEEEPAANRKKEEKKRNQQSSPQRNAAEERGGSVNSAQRNKKIKTIQQKEIKELNEHAPRYDTRIEDIRIAKPFRTNGLNCHTIEALLRYIDLTTEDNTTEVMDKLSTKRVDVTGAVATKEKKERGMSQFRK